MKPQQHQNRIVIKTVSVQNVYRRRDGRALGLYLPGFRIENIADVVLLWSIVPSRQHEILNSTGTAYTGRSVNRIRFFGVFRVNLIYVWFFFLFSFLSIKASTARRVVEQEDGYAFLLWRRKLSTYSVKNYIY